MTKQFSLFDNNSSDSKDTEINQPTELDISTRKICELSFDIMIEQNTATPHDILGIAVSKEIDKAYYVPIKHNNFNNIPQALDILKPIFEEKSVDKIGHNLKSQILILKKKGIQLNGKLYDTMIMTYLLNPTKTDYSLESVSLDYLSHRKNRLDDVIGKLSSLKDVPLNNVINFAAENADLIFKLKDILLKKLKDENLDDLYFDIEMPLIYVLADIEHNGIKIDIDKIQDISKELEILLENLQAKIYSLAGETFNINSTKQLAKILFEKLNLKPIRKIKTGYSTSIEILMELAKKHDLPNEILNYRTFYKLKTTYIDALPKLINKETKRIHTTFNQSATVTGRISSSKPNLQNIPIRRDWGVRIRKVFIPDENNILISADYSQIELRILTHISKDKKFIESFKNNLDIHSETASEIFGIHISKVTPDKRRFAKTINFGIVYGMSTFGLSEALNITPTEARGFIENFFQNHKNIKTYIDNIIEIAKQQGYVTTLLGRKRPLPAINSTNASIRQQSERMAINTPIQGSAADLIKIAMIRIYKRFSEEKLKTKMLLQIHDELVFESPEGEIENSKNLIKYEMENAMELEIPLIVDIGTGKNWAEAHI